MKNRLRGPLTSGMKQDRRRPSGGDAERGNDQVALPFKAVPRGTCEESLLILRKAYLELIDTCIEVCNNAVRYVEPMSGATPKSGEAWSDGTPLPTPDDEA